MEFIVLSLFLAAATTTVLGLPPVGMYQSSKFNEELADKAVDNDVNTCMMTGWERGAWWARVLPSAVNVTSVTIHGAATAFQVRIGNHMDESGDMGNFGSNGLCKYSAGLTEGSANVYQCEEGSQVGSVISVQAVDPAFSDRLKLCEVILHESA